MDFNAVRVIREYEMPEGLKSCKVQLLVLVTCWENLGSEVFPSEETLGKWCGCGVSTIRTSMHKLANAGLITIRRAIPEGGKGKYPTNHYGLGPNLKGHVATRVKELRAEQEEKKKRQKLAPDSTGTGN